MRSHSKIALVVAIALSSEFAIAEGNELATDMVRRNTPTAAPEAPLEQRIDQYSSVIPGELQRDTVADYISRLRMEKEYIDALLERNQSLENLNQLHRSPTQQVSTESSGGQSSDMDFGNQSTFRGNGDFPTGDMTSGSFTQRQFGGSEQGETRWASLDYTWALGGARVARVQWGNSFPTVRVGDVLPGGFKVQDITSDELVIEKEEVVVRMNQDRVSIDALMRAIAEQRAKSGQ
jgi:hypothetical protein